MQCLRTMLRFAAAPTFILLAAINYEASSTMSAHIGMSTGLPPSETLPFKLAPELSETLGSMWLMYVVMAVFHSGAWLGGREKRPRVRN